MRAIRRAAIWCSVALAAGCAAAPGPTTLPSAGQSIYGNAPIVSADAKSFLTLDQIQPVPQLPRPLVPTTDPSGPAPAESLKLYAQAHVAEQNNQRAQAILLLQQAVGIDPYSYEIYRLLGELYLSSDPPDARGTDAMEHAAAIRPDDIELRLALGRQYLSAEKIDLAIEQLRLAMQTSGYRRREDEAAAVDLMLARALEAAGYDRAAIDRYTSLLNRLNDPTAALRADGDVGFLVARPELIYLQIGSLYEKHGQFADALAAYKPAAASDPSNFDVQAKVATTLARLGRGDEAIRSAADVVMRFRASSESLTLLRDVCHATGRNETDELMRLYRQTPQPSIVFALSDTLDEQGKYPQAETLLESAQAKNPTDLEIVKKLFAEYDRHDQVEPATLLLINELAARPNSLRELSGLWLQLVVPARRNSLRITTLQKLTVKPEAEAARLFLVSRLADRWQRDALARGSLEQAVAQRRPFPPAYRELVADIWHRPDFDDAQKVKATADLADRATAGGDASLATEVRGLSMAHQDKDADAASALADAIKQAGGDPSPDLQITYASAVAAAGSDARAEQILTEVVDRHPADEDAWSRLFSLQIDKKNPDEAMHVLTRWLDADPGSVQARLLQAYVFIQVNNLSEAEAILNRLFEDHGDDADVDGMLYQVSQSQGKVDAFIARLEDRHARHPDDRAVTEMLVSIYSQSRRLADASRVLDGTRAALAHDADSLYSIAHLYEAIDQRSTTEEVLQQVLALDPKNAAANNDLGFAWSDRGTKMAESEAMIRIAVDAEPDNQAFLDSLGWVLYKRAKFAEARTYLEKAIGSAALPDPLVIDHYGDVLYRLGDVQGASKQWARALERIGPATPNDSPDARELRATLASKIQEAAAGKQVDVAPLAGTTTS
jgi:tetratricopeptide (TPR) repeat protein